MEKIVIPAKADKLQEVLDFVSDVLDSKAVDMGLTTKIQIAVEEIFINISSYAYGDSAGEAIINIDVDEAKRLVKITFADEGVPYDPLEKPDPDINLAASERPIGGLGIFMVKKMMTDVSYEYTEGQNRLTITKEY